MAANDESIIAMQERIRDVLITLAAYRVQHPEDSRIESVMTQLELVQSSIDSSASLSHSQKTELNFNLVEGTPLEHNDHLVGELYSIKNFAMNFL